MSDAFREASAYYMAGRPPYSRELLHLLQGELGLNGRGCLLDVGCGPGALTLELAPAFDESVGVDPDPGMLAEGRRRAGAAGLSGLRWVQESAEGLGRLDLGRFRLVTFGQSYHWTAGVPVLDTVHGMLEPGGAVALVGHRVEGRSVPAGPGLPRIPEKEIMQLVHRYADNDAALRQKGKRATPHLHAADVRASRFGACRIVYAPGRPDVVRTVDSVIAGYYSTSYAAPRTFGTRRASFETAVRALLLERSPTGLFWDWPGDTEIVLASMSPTPRRA
jgi:SAM-dependent methyltransferase